MTTAAPHAHGIHLGRKDIQLLAFGVGAVWAIVGILGFIPGITQNYSDLKFFGPDSNAMLFNAFQTSMLLNLVQIAVGVVGVLMAMSSVGSRRFLTYFGGLYVVLAIFGFVTGTSSANIFALSMVDSWFMIIVGLFMVGAALYLTTNVEDQT